MKITRESLRCCIDAATRMRQRYARDGVIIPDHEPSYWLWNAMAIYLSHEYRHAFGSPMAPHEDNGATTDIALDTQYRTALHSAVWEIFRTTDDDNRHEAATTITELAEGA